MKRWGRVVSVLAAVFALGGVTGQVSAGTAARAAGSARPMARAVGPMIGIAHAGPSLELFYTPPVLVRAGERVQIPVDASCTTAEGTVCAARVTLFARSGGRGWTSASAPSSALLRFDATEPADRALARGASGSVAFVIAEAVAPGGIGTPISLGTLASPLRFYVTRDMPTVPVPAVPFGRVSPGRTALYLPWGTGPNRAGIALGGESLTLGPPSFAVGGGGEVYLLDGLQGRLAVFRAGRLVRSVRLGRLSPDADVALSGSVAYVSTSDGGAVERAVTLRAVGAGARSAHRSTLVGHGIPERLTVASGAPYLRLLPVDEWGPGSGSGDSAALAVGRPLSDGSQLLSVVHDRAIRLATVRHGRVENALELSFTTALGELALAEPDGHGGYVVVVHVARDGASVADQYQVVHVADDRVVSTFAIARRDFAASGALSRFRLGPDGVLYQLATSPDGARVVRFVLGGVA